MHLSWDRSAIIFFSYLMLGLDYLFKDSFQGSEDLEIWFICDAECKGRQQWAMYCGSDTGIVQERTQSKDILNGEILRVENILVQGRIEGSVVLFYRGQTLSVLVFWHYKHVWNGAGFCISRGYKGGGVVLGKGNH